MMTRRYEINPDDEIDDDEAPDLEDALILGVTRRGYSLSYAGDPLDTFEEYDQAVKYARKWMKAARFYPAFYYVNERGNVEELTSGGKHTGRGWV